MDQEDPPPPAIPLLLPRPTDRLVRVVHTSILLGLEHPNADRKRTVPYIQRFRRYGQLFDLLQRRRDYPNRAGIRDAIGSRFRHGHGVGLLGQAEGRSHPSFLDPAWKAPQ